MILITNPKDHKSLRAYSHCPWIYLGNPRYLNRFSSVLDPNKRIYIGEWLQKLADEYRDHFVDFIGKIATDQPSKALWYSSRVASKSFSQTNAFHQYIYQKLIQEVSFEGEDVLFVTDDPDLPAISRSLNYSNIKVLSKKNDFLNNYLLSFKGYLKVLCFLIIWPFWLPLRNKELSQYNVIIHNWISRKVLRNLPTFVDTTFFDLGKKLKEQQKVFARMIYLRGAGLRQAFRLKAAEKDFIFPFAELSFSGLCRAIGTKFFIYIPDKVIQKEQDGTLLYELLQREERKEKQTKVYIDYLLNYEAYRSIGRRLSKNTVFIYPFENQPWEKMLNLACFSYSRIGYLHSTIPKNWLDHRRFAGEKDMPLPNIILTPGKVWSEFLECQYPNFPIRDVGAFRLNYLFDLKEAAGHRKENLVVVALSINETVSFALQNDLIKALRQGVFLGYRVVIKAHPYLKGKSLCKKAFVDFSNVFWTTENIDVLLSECSLLISTESLVLYEAVFQGIKTVCYVPEDISYGTEEFIKHKLFMAYSFNFESTIQAALDTHQIDPEPIKKYYSKPDYGQVLDVLEEMTNAY